MKTALPNPPKLYLGTRRSLFALAAVPIAFAGCLSALKPAGTGFETVLIGAAEMSMIDQIGDPELKVDAEKLQNKELSPGTGEYQAGMCLQNFIKGRQAEVERSKVSDEQQQQVLSGTIASSYGQCEHTCGVAATQQPNAYSQIAAKYQPLCAEAVVAQNTRWNNQALENTIAKFRSATQPLELFFAARDSQLLLTKARETNPDADLGEYENEVANLQSTHAAAIAKGKAFYEGTKAQDNFAERQSLEDEIDVLESEIKSLRKLQADYKRIGSLDAHMRARELDSQIRPKQRLIGTKSEQIARLKRSYEELAEAEGVFSKTKVQ